MRLAISYRCDRCGGRLELVNGYIRCSECFISEKTINKDEKNEKPEKKS